VTCNLDAEDDAEPVKNTPTGRVRNRVEVAPAYVFVASDGSSDITDEVISITRGRLDARRSRSGCYALATVPGVGAIDLGLSLLYSALLIAVLALTYLTLIRRNMRD
jgi:hypothetical protein